MGLALHPFDLATNEVFAMPGRMESRDWIDARNCDQDWGSRMLLGTEPLSPSSCRRRRGPCLFQKSHAAGLHLADGADDLHAPAPQPSLTLGRLGELPDCPSDVGFDRLAETFLQRRPRIEVRQPGQDAVHKDLDPGAVQDALVSCLQRGVDRAAPLVPALEDEVYFSSNQAYPFE